VYNYCTTSRPLIHRSPTAKGVTGANFVGEELYMKLVDFLRNHMRGLLKVRVLVLTAAG
jgi:hypothetical protein